MQPPVDTPTRLPPRHVMFAEVAEMKAIAQGLSAIAPAKALWKLSDSDQVALGNASISVGHNVKIVKWVNQNDVLGHPKVKVFFTQGGTNSFNEVGSLLGCKACLCSMSAPSITLAGSTVLGVARTLQGSQVNFDLRPLVLLQYCVAAAVLLQYYTKAVLLQQLQGICLCYVASMRHGHARHLSCCHEG